MFFQMRQDSEPDNRRERRSLTDRLCAFPRRPGVVTRAARRATAVLLRAVLRSYHRLRIIGRENLPTTGPFVLVANHASHLDVLCLLAAVPLRDLDRVYPTASADYFFSSLPRAAAAALLFNGVPFHRPGRGDDANVRESLERCRELLLGYDSRPGSSVVILFPEGSRTTDGSIRPFKRGVGVMVAGTDVPVVPCRLEGTFDAMPKGRWIPWPRRVTLRIGRARTYGHLGTGKLAAQHVARELYDAVVALGRTGPTMPPKPVDADEPAVHLAA